MAKALRNQSIFRERAAKKVLAKYALLIQGDAKKNLREDPRRIDDGTLWNSIQILLTGLVAQVFTNIDYAAFVHWGTGIHGKNPKGGHRLTPWIYFDEKRQKFFVTTGMEPNMFLKNAWDKYRERFVLEMKVALRKSDLKLSNVR